MNTDRTYDRQALRAELLRDEGEKLIAYQDSVGLWTIGVGHLLGTQPRMQRITRSESRALLENDIDLAAGVLSGLIEDWDGLDDVRQRALLNMAFNLGPRLAGFVDFLAAVRARRWDAAAAEMINSKWAKQVGERAKRLAEMMRTGRAG